MILYLTLFADAPLLTIRHIICYVRRTVIHSYTSYPEAVIFRLLLHEVDGVLQFVRAGGPGAEPLHKVLEAIVGGVPVPLPQRRLRGTRAAGARRT